MNLPNNTLVLVADGRKMLFLRNHGEAAQIDLRVEAHREQDNPRNQDQASDAPGRSFASVGTRRSAMEESDFHQIEEDRFAAEAADLLRERALRGDFDALVVVAPPRTLGVSANTITRKSRAGSLMRSIRILPVVPSTKSKRR